MSALAQGRQVILGVATRQVVSRNRDVEVVVLAHVRERSRRRFLDEGDAETTAWRLELRTIVARQRDLPWKIRRGSLGELAHPGPTLPPEGLRTRVERHSSALEAVRVGSNTSCTLSTSILRSRGAIPSPTIAIWPGRTPVAPGECRSTGKRTPRCPRQGRSTGKERHAARRRGVRPEKGRNASRGRGVRPGTDAA